MSTMSLVFHISTVILVLHAVLANSSGVASPSLYGPVGSSDSTHQGVCQYQLQQCDQLAGAFNASQACKACVTAVPGSCNDKCLRCYAPSPAIDAAVRLSCLSCIPTKGDACVDFCAVHASTASAMTSCTSCLSRVPVGSEYACSRCINPPGSSLSAPAIDSCIDCVAHGFGGYACEQCSRLAPNTTNSSPLIQQCHTCLAAGHPVADCTTPSGSNDWATAQCDTLAHDVLSAPMGSSNMCSTCVHNASQPWACHQCLSSSWSATKPRAVLQGCMDCVATISPLDFTKTWACPGACELLSSTASQMSACTQCVSSPNVKIPWPCTNCLASFPHANQTASMQECMACATRGVPGWVCQMCSAMGSVANVAACVDCVAGNSSVWQCTRQSPRIVNVTVSFEMTYLISNTSINTSSDSIPTMSPSPMMVAPHRSTPPSIYPPQPVPSYMPASYPASIPSIYPAHRALQQVISPEAAIAACVAKIAGTSGFDTTTVVVNVQPTSKADASSMAGSLTMTPLDNSDTKLGQTFDRANTVVVVLEKDVSAVTACAQALLGAASPLHFSSGAWKVSPSVTSSLSSDSSTNTMLPGASPLPSLPSTSSPAQNTVSPSPSKQSTSRSVTKKGGLSPGAAAGVAIAVVACVAASVVAVVLVVRRRRNGRKNMMMM